MAVTAAAKHPLAAAKLLLVAAKHLPVAAKHPLVAAKHLLVAAKLLAVTAAATAAAQARRRAVACWASCSATSAKRSLLAVIRLATADAIAVDVQRHRPLLPHQLPLR